MELTNKNKLMQELALLLEKFLPGHPFGQDQ
jgi:hypothetical protein